MIKILKKDILKKAALAEEGHIASAFSVLDILWVLYDKVLNYDPKNPNKLDRDRFILSKGHASLGLYVVLAEKGFFNKSELEKFCKFDGLLGGHPDRNKVPGVETSTGSLGHGFPMAIGIAMGMRIRKLSSKVFVLIGDGEANEGTIWESALLASHHNLGSLICIVDYNHSTDRALKVGDLESKFRSFDWETRVINGHDHKQIYEALVIKHSKPLAVIAETIKGYGSKLMENNPAWHHKFPNQEELEIMLKDLE